MVNLVIDIGNSRSKFAVFNNRQLIRVGVLDADPVDQVCLMLSEYAVENSIISSVRKEVTQVEHLLQQNTSCIRFSTALKTPVTNTYKTPETLGLDRFAAIIGAQAIFPGQNSLVIDAGTCITYDAISADKVYAGGSISPGLNMRLQAMHTFTGRLPFLEFKEDWKDWQGVDTRSAMLSGVLNGAFFEVLGFIQEYSSHYADLQVLLCGGDANFFDTRLKNSIFSRNFKAEPHLVLIGLNEVIHQYND